MTQTIKPTILFKRPELIDSLVTFPLPDGTEAKIRCKFQYRTRKEFGALWDELTAIQRTAADKEISKNPAKEAKAKAQEETQAFSFEAMFSNGDEVNAQNTLRFLKAWDEELPELSKDVLAQMFDEAPASHQALWNAYRTLCTTGALGN